MNILFVCHRFPFPPKRGGKIRPFNIIRHLSGRGHRVTVASLARNQAEAVEGEGLSEHCAEQHVEVIGDAAGWARMLLRLPTTVPSSMGYFYSPALAARIRRLLDEQSFDLIFVHCSSVAQYVEHVCDTPMILDFGDMDSQKWLDYRSFKPWPLSLGYWLEGRKLEREEKRLARKFTLSTCTTRAELNTLESFAAAPLTGWFPNGVDRSYFAPAERDYEPNLVCFVGRMDYYPNQEAMLRFCREAWPLLQQARPELRLQIVGADPTPAIRALGELQNVEVTGSVPDVRPYVSRSALTIAPLAIARGTQNKILESMALGVPVVCSSRAAGGVDAVPGEHLLVADETTELVEAIIRVTSDPQLRVKLAEAGLARVRTHHDWQASLKRLDQIIEQAAPRAQAVAC